MTNHRGYRRRNQPIRKQERHERGGCGEDRGKQQSLSGVRGRMTHGERVLILNACTLWCIKERISKYGHITVDEVMEERRN